MGTTPMGTGTVPPRPRNNDDEDDSPNPNPSEVATMATVLDTAAAVLNGGYALTGDIVFFVCPTCYGAVIWGYSIFSYVPNSLSTVAMGLWFMDGVDSGENNLTITQTAEQTTLSVSLSQDTVLAVGTNLAGWTVLREPNVAFFVDAGVAAYDYGRLGTIPFVETTIPTWINPTVTYDTRNGIDFSWQRGR